MVIIPYLRTLRLATFGVLLAMSLFFSLAASAREQWSPPDPDSWTSPPRAFSWAGFPHPIAGTQTSAVTPARDQFHPKPTGTCWAHIILAALESRVILDEILAGVVPTPASGLFDYSEYDLVRSLASTSGDCSKGGQEAEAVAYLARASSVPNSCASLDMCFAKLAEDDSRDCRPLYTPLGWARLPDDDNAIKSALYNLGPVTTQIRTRGTNFHETAPGQVFAAPCEPNKPLNHGLLIVGYDDDLEYKNNDGSIGHGAWLVKNSNPKWANNGFGWVAYGAGCIGTFATTFTEVGEFIPEEEVYYFDEYGATTRFGDTALGPEQIMVHFIPREEGVADRVDLWAMSEDTSYKIKLYEGFDGKKPFSELTSEEGTLKLRGYYSIPLENKVDLTEGVPIYLLVEFDAPEALKPIPVDARGKPSGATYYSRDGETFRPLGGGDAAIRLRALPTWSFQSRASALDRGSMPIYLNGFDSDDDQIPDRVEVLFHNNRRSMNPSDPEDGHEDFDGDGLANVDEYFSGHDPFRADAPSINAASSSVLEWGDANGDGKLSRMDLLSMYGRSSRFGKSRPLDPEEYRLDLDGDGVIGRSDRSILKGLIKNGPGAYFPARPERITVLAAPRRKLEEGEVVRITLAVLDGVGRRSPGIPLVISVDKAKSGGKAGLYGGSAVKDGGRDSVFVVTSARDDGAVATVFLRAQGMGRVYLDLRTPPLGPEDDPRHVPTIFVHAPIAVDIAR